MKTHILNELIDKCLKYDKDFEKLRLMGTYLTPFAVQIRYPDNSFDITEIETKKALIYTENIIEFITKKMEQETKDK